MGCCLSCLRSEPNEDYYAVSGNDVGKKSVTIKQNLETSFQLAARTQGNNESDLAPLLQSEYESRRVSTSSEPNRSVYSTAPVVVSEPSIVDESPSRSAMLPIFEGIFLELKFTAQSKFGNKFVWVDLAKKTFQISDHRNKQKRHKEANLSAIVSVDAVPPTVFASCTTTVGAAPGEVVSVSSDDVYATVKFVLNDGGVDLKFASTESRDDFVRHLSTVLNRIKEKETSA